MNDIYNQAKCAATELLERAGLKSGDLAVIGCSTSEVLGERIGTAGSLETANDILKGIIDAFYPAGVKIAAQCCEHLNRALVIEKEDSEKYNYEQVCAVPHEHAGGSFATAAYRFFKNPVLVEEIKADAGLDIGRTMIGMHLKRVAVPLRLDNNTIGCAHVDGAKTRPKYIGGERAKYE